MTCHFLASLEHRQAPPPHNISEAFGTTRIISLDISRPSDHNLSATMAESVGAAADEHHVDTDTNYRKAMDLLRKTWQEIYEMSGAEARDPERLEKLQQKAIDIAKVIELVEREFELVEEDDWQPTLTAAPASRERKSVRRADSREVDDTREPAGQMARTNETVLGTTDEGAAPAAYRPAESYRRPSETMYQPPLHRNSMSQDGLREINDT